MRTTLASSRLRIHPGTPATLEVEVVNTSDVIDGVTATVLGLDPAWVRTTPPVVTLFPDTIGRLVLEFDVPTTCPAGDSMLMLRIVSTVDPTRVSEHDVWLTVDPVESATMQLRPSVVVGGSDCEIDVEITNTGNVTTEYVIGGIEPTRAVECTAEPASVLVQPGRTATALLYAKGPRPWFGQTPPRILHITATSPGVALKETARFTQKPRIPRGVLTALILAGIIALWAFVFLFVVHLIRSGGDPKKSVSDTWNKNGAQSVNLADVAGSVSGTVTASTTGQGLARITVEAFRIIPNAPEPELTSSAATEDDGTYVLGALLPGNYVLRFSADGYDPSYFPGTPDQTAAQVVRIDPLAELPNTNMTLAGQAGQLGGKVPTPDGGDPSAPATVTVTMVPARPGDPVPAPVTVTTGPDGSFEVPGLPTPAVFEVRVEREGFDPQVTQVELSGGQAAVLDNQQLSASDGSIQGVVVDASGTPLGDVTVTLRSGTIERVSSTPTVGNVGTFQIDNLTTPRTYVITFTREGFADATISLDLAGGQSRNGLRVVLAGGSGVVSGTVRDAAGNPLGGVGITVVRGAVKATTTSLTAGDGGAGVGSYRISDLPAPGTYTVTFTLAGYSTETTTVTFGDSGDQPVVNMTMSLSTGTVSGRVTVGGSGRAGLTLTLSDGATPRTTQSASSPSGGYEFAGVPPGTYMLQVTGSAVQETVVVVEVVAGQTTARDVAVLAK